MGDKKLDSRESIEQMLDAIEKIEGFCSAADEKMFSKICCLTVL
jgi:uncharacterized protein with HEPN domain